MIRFLFFYLGSALFFVGGTLLLYLWQIRRRDIPASKDERLARVIFETGALMLGLSLFRFYLDTIS